jgi:hypothetical protein
LIIKPSRIKAGDHAQALAYILALGDEAKHANEQVDLLNGHPEALALHCATSHECFPSKSYTLRHWKINPEEAVSEQTLQAICYDLLEEFKAGERPYVIALHTTTDKIGQTTTHAHLMVAELNDKGRVLSNKNNAAREHKLARKWEKELGHTILSSRYDETIIEHTNDEELASSLNTDAECIYGYTQNQYQKARALGVDLFEIKKIITAARNEPHDINDLRIILKSHGVDLIRGKKQGILVLEKDGEPLCPLHKAGAFHKDIMLGYAADFEKGNLNEDIIKSSEELSRECRNEETEFIDATSGYDVETVNSFTENESRDTGFERAETEGKAAEGIDEQNADERTKDTANDHGDVGSLSEHREQRNSKRRNNANRNSSRERRGAREDDCGTGATHQNTERTDARNIKSRKRLDIRTELLAKIVRRFNNLLAGKLINRAVKANQKLQQRLKARLRRARTWFEEAESLNNDYEAISTLKGQCWTLGEDYTSKFAAFQKLKALHTDLSSQELVERLMREAEHKAEQEKAARKAALRAEAAQKKRQEIENDTEHFNTLSLTPHPKFHRD